MDVAAVVGDCGVRAQGLATRRQLLAAGLSPGVISRAVAAGQICRLHRRVYAARPLEPWPRFVVTDKGTAAAYVAHVRAALLAIGPGAVAHRRTAAALYGWSMLIEPSRTVEVAVPHGSRRSCIRGTKVTERRDLRTCTVTPDPDADGLPVTSPARTVVDCCLSLSLMQAVVICDSALRSSRVTVEDLLRASVALGGVKDAHRVRRVLELCDPASGSVLESVLRVQMLLRGINGFDTQHVIRTADGSHVLRTDFVFPDARLVVEVDGQKWHQDVARDQRLANALAALGWRVLRYTWAEVVHEPEEVLAEIERAVGLRTDDCHLTKDEVQVAA